MNKGIIGKKIGMTQIFDEKGNVIPVTVIETAGNIVSQIKTVETDGYNAIQLGYGEIKDKHINKPEAGHFAKAKIANKNTKITVILDTENGHDEIVGFGHDDLTLTHPTDIVCRTSGYVCPRTLMINADKAARDLDSDLIEDLKNEKEMEVTIILV